MDCKFNRTCKKYNTDDCSNRCYPYVMLHGIDGIGGFWATSGIPSKYANNLIESLPVGDGTNSKKIHERIKSYVSNVVELVLTKNIGLYLYGGTGTGKTTIATTILNEYLIGRTRLHLRGELPIKGNPVAFIKAAEFQNIFNAQFRGPIDVQTQNSERFYKLKEKMKQVELLVVDDLALRDCTDSFKNELYEIIDYRATSECATIVTSNVRLTSLGDYVGDRSASRIEGMCVALEVAGSDHRKGGLF